MDPIISIGEAVWDIFPDRTVLGGAPVNVAYHLRCLKMNVKVVSRIGPDELGTATLARLAELGLPTAGIQRDVDLPTGRVNVTVDHENEPHFDIVAPAAWDNIRLEEALPLLDGKGFCLVFGTLAQRDPRTRKAIRGLWPLAGTLFYDVNLRPPFTGRELVLDSLAAADIVKMNVLELSRIAGWLNIACEDRREAALQIVNSYRLLALAVTEGGDGAWLMTPGGLFSQPGEPVEVADTVGAGDAFFAALINGFMKKRPWEECLAAANRRGAYVATRHGATPDMARYA